MIDSIMLKSMMLADGSCSASWIAFFTSLRINVFILLYLECDSDVRSRFRFFSARILYIFLWMVLSSTLFDLILSSPDRAPTLLLLRLFSF